MPHSKDITLILNGAEETLQIAVADDSRVLAARQVASAGQAMRLLAPGIADVLAEAGLTRTDLTRLACARGPGSFTGLRLVLATATGLAVGLGLDCAGLDSLPLLAASVPAGPDGALAGTVAVLTHSRQKQVYAQFFDAVSRKPRTEAQSLGTGEAARLLSAFRTEAGPVHVLGSGLRRNLDDFRFLPGLNILDAPCDVPSWDGLLAAALAATYSPEPIRPIYLRPSDAEENLSAIIAASGLSPETARDILSADDEPTI